MFGRASKKSFFLQPPTSQSIDVGPTKEWWHYDAWCKHWRKDRQNV